jgi:hypothetical protein
MARNRVIDVSAKASSKTARTMAMPPSILCTKREHSSLYVLSSRGGSGAV